MVSNCVAGIDSVNCVSSTTQGAWWGGHCWEVNVWLVPLWGALCGLYHYRGHYVANTAVGQYVAGTVMGDTVVLFKKTLRKYPDKTSILSLVLFRSCIMDCSLRPCSWRNTGRQLYQNYPLKWYSHLRLGILTSLEPLYFGRIRVIL